jgi:hypothetical protein
MRLTVAKEEEYVPQWNGNVEEDEPVKFTLSYLTTADRDACIPVDFNEEGEFHLKPDYRKLFTKGVRRIEGLYVNDKPIKTPLEVLNTPGLYELYMEVATHLLTMNVRRDSKN